VTADFIYYDEEKGGEQEPLIPVWFLCPLDISWFICLGLTTKLLPDSPPIKVSYALATEAEINLFLSQKNGTINPNPGSLKKNLSSLIDVDIVAQESAIDEELLVDDVRIQGHEGTFRDLHILEKLGLGPLKLRVDVPGPRLRSPRQAPDDGL